MKYYLKNAFLPFMYTIFCSMIAIENFKSSYLFLLWSKKASNTVCVKQGYGVWWLELVIVSGSLLIHFSTDSNCYVNLTVDPDSIIYYIFLCESNDHCFGFSFCILTTVLNCGYCVMETTVKKKISRIQG